ncbi:MAG: hypothetical protein R3E86_14575 [Pseudomonadales bacterium]
MNAIRLRGFWIAVLLLAPGVTGATVHVGAHNPLNEAWLVTSGDSGVSGAPVAPDADFPGVFAWQINSSTSGRLRYEIAGPQAGDSWVYSARLRVINLNEGLDLLMEVANGSRRFLLGFGSDADGATLIDLQGSDFPEPQDIVVPPTQPGRTDYVHIQLAFDAAAGAADLFVNGGLVASGYTGFDGTLQRVNFGDGSTAGATEARFSHVDFTIGKPACGDGVDNDGDGTADFGADANCQSAADPVEGVYCPVGEDIDNDGVCEEVFISHRANTDPSLEGWLAPAAAGGQSWQPGDEDLGAGNCDFPCPFWRITDNGTASGDLGTYKFGPFDASAPGGWELRAKVRVRPLTDGVAEGITYAKSMYARFPVGGGTREFGVLLGVTADAVMQLQPSGGGAVLDIGSTNDYHDVRVVYDPPSQTADILVDGQLVAADTAGRFISGITEFLVNVGSGASGEIGRTHWHEIAFEINPDTDNDGLLNNIEAGLGTDPYNSDTDEDGLADGAEIAAGTNPQLADTDGDGLTDGFEVAGGMDPLAADEDGDLDGDGLTNLDEQRIGTLPLVADTDGDGLDDGLEVVTLGTNPLTTDTDADGLPDGEEEMLYRTDPALADSDHDAVNDGDELAAGTDPLDPDSDDDGLMDGLERNAGTNPLVADTDGDGLGDGFEHDNGFDPLAPGEQDQDGDADGLDNLAEQIAGTSPGLADTDGDGLNDADEINVRHTDPTRVDTDGDGLTDPFEIAMGFNPQFAPDGARDADNDGLSNVDEQRLGLNPLDADSDDDGLLDGEETYIFGTVPQRSDPPGSSLSRSTHLEFEALDQPLFDNLPAPTFVDLAPLIAEQTGGTVRQGRVETINRSPSTLTAQDIWDEGVATCDAYTYVAPVHSNFKACRNLSVSPTRSECINGGNVSFASRSVTCCADVIFGIPDGTDDINNGCAFGNSEQSFTINDLNALPGGPYVSPTSINVGSGFGPRPTSDTPLPPRQYQIGAEITQNIQATGGLTITPGLSQADPGDVDMFYDTNASVRTSQSVVPPGEVFTLTLDHAPVPYAGARFSGTQSNCETQRAASSGSCLSSRWPNFLTALDLDINFDIGTQAEIWSIDPKTGDQLHQIKSLSNETLGRSYELAAFEWKIGDALNMRLLNDVPTVPPFIQQDISITNDDVFGLWSPGTQLPLPIDIPFGCILKKISAALCVTLGMPDNLGFSTNLMTFQLQIPELNSPVSQADPSDPRSRGFNGGAPSNFSIEKVEPLRHHLDGQGQLINTVPNKFRPGLNLGEFDGSADSLLDTFIFNNTDLSSDVFRYELDLDGIVCISSSGTGCLGVTAGIPLVANISVDAVDLDLVLWTGWDATMTFTPNLQARLTFTKTVLVRTSAADPFVQLPAGQPLLVDVPTDGLQDVQVIQPDGGVDVAVEYSFEGNTFTSTSQYAVKLAAEASYLQAQIGGLLGAVYEHYVGVPWRVGLLNAISEAPPIPAQTLTSTYTMSGTQMVFQGPTLRIVDAGSDLDGDGLLDVLESASCTAVDDADTDDDGLPDGIEDANRDGMVSIGETDPCNADSDGDGLQDGYERGLVTPNADTDLALFQPNPAPLVRTDPNNTDTDGDGFSDAQEVAEGSDPTDRGDCPPSACRSSILRLIPLLRKEAGS